ncbi:hypothetical protein ES703_98379 [subsurface metagenome]
MKKKTKKERTAKKKITGEEALVFLDRLGKGEIKFKDQKEKELLENITSQVIEGLAQPGEKERTLPVARKMSLTPKDLKEITAFKPPATRYIELPLPIINAAELTEYQEGKNGSLIAEYCKEGIPFIVSPLGHLTLRGKKMFFGILPHLKREYQGKKVIKYSNHDIDKETSGEEPKGGKKTYELTNKESFKIANFRLYCPSTEKGEGRTRYILEGTPCYLYDRRMGETGRKKIDHILIETPILASSGILNQLTRYHLDNILKATNTHELNIYLYLKTKVKPKDPYHHIGEDKLIRHAWIHAEKKIHQRRDLKIALENLEKDYQILYGKLKNIYFFYLLKKRHYTKVQIQAIKNLLNQGKKITGESIEEQWEKDQEERMRNQGHRIRTQRRAQKSGITDDTLIWCYDNYTPEEIEKQVNLLAERNPKNPNPLLKAALKGHYTIPGKRDREDEEARQERARIR